MRLEEVHKDWRGSTFVLKEGEKELCMISTSCNGALRGGHSHPYDTHLVIVKGVVDIVWTDDPHKPEESKWKRYDMKNPNIFIPKDMPHIAVAVGDVVVTELRGSAKLKTDNYPPYRNIIEMKKPMNVEEVLEILKKA